MERIYMASFRSRTP